MAERWLCLRMLLVLTLLGMVVACRPRPADARLKSASTATPFALFPAGPTGQPEDGPLDTPVSTQIVRPSPESTEASPLEGMTMILTVLFDNNPHDPRLQTGWGFAAWIEYGDRIVLFDTGADGAVLLGNMAVLDLDPRAINIVVLSHEHADHIGGLAGLLAVNPQVTLYLPHAFPSRFKEQACATGATVVEVASATEILPGLWSTGQMGTDIVEQALVARTERGLVVITGCAHPGVDKMVARAREIGQGAIVLVVGGFHLGGASRRRIEEILGEFRRLKVQQVAPCHCTGDQACELFREAYGPKYHSIGVGWQW
jgi:7,8-dihydropterin-6-yl-methyl-4-(beta-D-ribofuranosyl)aminobenzene 5'-phosphate synthase